MSAEIGRAGLLLIDKSAWVRPTLPEVPASVDFCFADITRLEILHSARDFAEYQAHEADLDLYRTLASNAETWAIARGAHRELAARGRHRLSLPDLLVAACAQQYGADVLHHDRHFDTLAEVLAFRPIRVDG